MSRILSFWALLRLRTCSYYLTADGSFECAVPLEKEGPVQDVAWVPGNMQFVVLYGFMPGALSVESSVVRT